MFTNLRSILFLTNVVIAQSFVDCSYRAAALHYVTQQPNNKTRHFETDEERIAISKTINLLNLAQYITKASKAEVDILVLNEGIFWDGILHVDDGLFEEGVIQNQESWNRHRRRARLFGDHLHRFSNGTIPWKDLFTKNATWDDVISHLTDHSVIDYKPVQILSFFAKIKNINIFANVVGYQSCEEHLEQYLQRGGTEEDYNSIQNPCAEDGYRTFNVLVSIDNQGRITAVHPKYFLLEDTAIFDVDREEDRYITTAVTWSPIIHKKDSPCPDKIKVGLSISTDIYYSVPWNETTIKEHDLDLIAHSSLWFSDPPIYHVGMIEQGLSAAYGTSIVGANGGFGGNGGGIFTNGEKFTETYRSRGNNEVLLITDLPSRAMESCYTSVTTIPAPPVPPEVKMVRKLKGNRFFVTNARKNMFELRKIWKQRVKILKKEIQLDGKLPVNVGLRPQVFRSRNESTKSIRRTCTAGANAGNADEQSRGNCAITISIPTGKLELLEVISASREMLCQAAFIRLPGAPPVALIANINPFIVHGVEPQTSLICLLIECLPNGNCGPYRDGNFSKRPTFLGALVDMHLEKMEGGATVIPIRVGTPIDKNTPNKEVQLFPKVHVQKKELPTNHWWMTYSEPDDIGSLAATGVGFFGNVHEGHDKNQPKEKMRVFI